MGEFQTNIFERIPIKTEKCESKKITEALGQKKKNATTCITYLDANIQAVQCNQVC